jgi:NADH-quinone oxidoreductase subunit M
MANRRTPMPPPCPISMREWAMMVPLAAVVLWMGVYPESFLAPMRKDIAALDARLAHAKPHGDADVKAGTGKSAAEEHAPTEHSAHGGAH